MVVMLAIMVVVVVMVIGAAVVGTIADDDDDVFSFWVFLFIPLLVSHIVKSVISQIVSY